MLAAFFSYCVTIWRQLEARVHKCCEVRRDKTFKFFRLSPLELDDVKRQVTDLLAKGMIRPSTFPYYAPILFVG